MRTVRIAVVAALVWVGGAVVAVGPTPGSESPASAAHAVTMAPVAKAKQRCVSRAEYKRVKRGWGVKRVHRVFGTRGRVIFAAPNPGTMKFTTRQYRTCARPRLGALTVDFGNGRLIGKYRVFSSRRDTPRCMSDREFRRVKRGLSPRRVARIADTAGGFLDGFAGGYARGYDLCRKTKRAKHAVVTYVWRGGKPNAVKVYDKRRTTVWRR